MTAQLLDLVKRGGRGRIEGVRGGVCFSIVFFVAYSGYEGLWTGDVSSTYTHLSSRATKNLGQLLEHIKYHLYVNEKKYLQLQKINMDIGSK